MDIEELNEISILMIDIAKTIVDICRREMFLCGWIFGTHRRDFEEIQN